MTVSTHGLRLKNGSHAWRTGCGVAVFDAVFNFAADGHLHRLGHWHGAQAKRATQQLRQPVWPILGAGIWLCQFDFGLQRVVVFADPGFFGHQHQLMRFAQHPKILADWQSTRKACVSKA